MTCSDTLAMWKMNNNKLEDGTIGLSPAACFRFILSLCKPFHGVVFRASPFHVYLCQNDELLTCAFVASYRLDQARYFLFCCFVRRTKSMPSRQTTGRINGKHTRGLGQLSVLVITRQPFLLIFFSVLTAHIAST